MASAQASVKRALLAVRAFVGKVLQVPLAFAKRALKVDAADTVEVDDTAVVVVGVAVLAFARTAYPFVVRY